MSNVNYNIYLTVLPISLSRTIIDIGKFKTKLEYNGVENQYDVGLHDRDYVTRRTPNFSTILSKYRCTRPSNFLTL
jgi:hypothetical protein